MRQIPYNELSFLQLQIFLVAGKELNFTRTSKRCHVTQPTVSRSIDALEKATGLQLFIKERSSMRLTPAGKVLHQALENTFDTLQNGFAHAWEVQEGYKNVLNIRFPDTIFPEIIFEITKRFKKKNENIKVHYQLSADFRQDMYSLLSYESDFVITHMHNDRQIELYDELTSIHLIETPLTAIMKRTNPLSSRRYLNPAELRGQKIIFPKDNTEPIYETMIMETFSEAGILSNISLKVASAKEGVYNLQDDDEVVILNHFGYENVGNAYAEIPIKGSASGLVLVFRTVDQDKQLMQAYIQCAQAYCKKLDYSLDV
jgi:DNA-binding transcriptional LysR family regulator